MEIDDIRLVIYSRVQAAVNADGCSNGLTNCLRPTAETKRSKGGKGQYFFGPFFFSKFFFLSLIIISCAYMYYI